MQEFPAQGNGFRMNSTLKIFLDILRRQAGPEDLPASPRLLWGAFVLLLLLQAGLGTWLVPEDRSILPQAIVSGLASLLWLALVLRLFGRPERFVQTASAMLGIACLFAPISIPVIAQVRPAVGEPANFSPLAALAFAISLYLIYINGRILRAAIERPLFQCIALFLLGELVVFSLLLTLGFGDAAS